MIIIIMHITIYIMIIIIVINTSVFVANKVPAQAFSIPECAW